MKCARLWYKKTGAAIYISHLDLNRAFQRAVIRADIPLWYTEGFNPHAYMTFPAPLPLGQEGMREPVDIRLTEDLPCEQVQARLNLTMPEGIVIADATEPIKKANDIAFAKYSILCDFLNENDCFSFAQSAREIISSGNLPADKKSKSGIKQVNLLDFIKDISFESRKKELFISCILSCGCRENLNPALLLDTLFEKCGIFSDFTKITREKLLLCDGSDFE